MAACQSFIYKNRIFFLVEVLRDTYNWRDANGIIKIFGQ